MPASVIEKSGAIKILSQDFISIGATSTLTALDTGRLSKEIEIFSFCLSAEHSGMEFKVYAYDVYGNATSISYTNRGPTLYTGLKPDYFNEMTVSKENSLFKLTNYDTTNNRYSMFLKIPIRCYGIKIVITNVASSTQHATYTIVYREIEK